MKHLTLGLIVVTLGACQPNPSVITSRNCQAIQSATLNIEGQTNYLLGRDSVYPEEREHLSSFSSFDIDNTEVTNAQFAQFVEATNYVTTAELPQPGFEKDGGAVFKSPTAHNPNWWQFVEGANWRHPEGPESNIVGRGDEPVVQVSFIDAQRYAQWAGRALPTEAQWEFAARGGTQTPYPWGTELSPKGESKANTWQGVFPVQNTQDDSFRLRAPVGCYDANGYGLYDMIGNVWEWTQSEYDDRNAPNNFAIKGGSFLCAPDFCARYRPAARQSQEADFSTNHIGFRTVSKSP